MLYNHNYINKSERERDAQVQIQQLRLELQNGALMALSKHEVLFWSLWFSMVFN